MLQLKQRVLSIRRFAVARDPAWKFALGAYLVARVALGVWSLVLFSIFPTVLQNLDLFGAPVLAVFDLESSERYAYSRVIDGATLTFRASARGFVADAQTGSVWSLRDGRAISGIYAGRVLAASAYLVEDVFPYHGVAAEKTPLLALWQRFDTNWYLAIAARGYAAEGSAVFFPLYPLLVRVVGTVVGDAMIAALLVSNLSLIGALAVLYRLSESVFGASSARRASVYLLLFPTAFFLFAAYTESLFLLLALSAFALAQRSRWFVAAGLGALAALTRLQGVLLIVPLAYAWWKAEGGAIHASRFTLRGSRGFTMLLIPMATIAFLALTNLSLLTSYEGRLHARFVWPWENVWAAMTLLARGQGSFIDALNLVATLGLGALLIPAWRKLPREYGLYALAMYLAPLFRMTTTQPLVSMARYALAVFPVFLLLGAWGTNAWVNRAVVYLSFPLQLFLSAQFIIWGWVG